MLDPRTNQPTNSFQLSDGTRHRTHSYHDETWEATNSGLWPSKQPEFRTESKDVADESGICSPPLWKTSPPTSPQHGGRNHHYRSLSPASRTQAIVRGQRELMEMVKNMPESNYELSLKDLVEHQRVDARREKSVEERSFRKDGGGRKVARVKRSGGKVDHHGGGFYLKMVLPPFSLWSKDKKKKKMKKKNETLVNGSSKVSPKPSSGFDKEWWKKSPSAFRESDSGASSINSGSMKSTGSSSSSSTNSNSRYDPTIQTSSK